MFLAALSIYSRSPAAYDAIQSWGIFHLPSKGSLKQYTTTCLQQEGPYFDYIKDQAEKYKLYQEECINSGMKKNLGEGVLILDEVKVVGKIAWNSQNGQICGIEMDKKEILSLKSLGKDMLHTEQHTAEYYLQFLWRDLSSDFDVIGPHYSSSKTMNSGFTHGCLLDALDAFQLYGFVVSFSK